MFHQQPAIFPVSRKFGFIRLDTANVMRSTLHQCFNQLVCLRLLQQSKNTINYVQPRLEIFHHLIHHNMVARNN